MSNSVETNTKYFTPDIEDFHVGYEFQRFIPKSNATEEECWGTIKLPVNYLTLDEIDNEIIEKEIRVPYLTKEKIEAEGWVEDKGLYKLRKNEDLFFTIDFNTDSYFLIINSYSKINTTFYSGNSILKGKCKDINTFRRIIKLLEI